MGLEGYGLLKYKEDPVMGLETLVYSPLFEDCTPDLTGWSKETVDYIIENQKKVYRSIRGIAKGLNKNMLQTADVEDIYSEILMYCYQYDDYNINKAIERSSTGMIVSLEGYVHNCIKFCVMRHLTQMYATEKETVREGIKSEDGKELSIFDTIEDGKSTENYDDLMYDLASLCRHCESIRYKYGPDIYLIWYVRLLTISEDKDTNAFKELLNILGISKKDIAIINEKSIEDELVLSFAKCISLTGIDESISIIEKYVYSADKIREAVKAYL